MNANRMEKKFLSVNYELYSVKDGERLLEEQTSKDRPFQFISGFGITLDAMEKILVEKSAGEEFDFTLSPTEAFGEYRPEGVHQLSRDMFCIDGKFDNDHVYEGAVVTLSDAEERRFMAQVTAVDAEHVMVDANHPVAGKSLNFKGEVLENRPATEEEVKSLIRKMAGGGCGGCGGCGDGGCGDGSCGDGGCNGGCCGS